MNNLLSPEPQYKVGDVFRHKRYHYYGVIFGWTSSCTPLEGELWIEAMKVDSLPKGRQQPFYNVLVTDSSVRYVAEENIIPVNPSSPPAGLEELAGKYFKRFDPVMGKFVSNVTHEFPDE